MSIIGNFLKRNGLNPDAEMNFMEHVEAFRWHLIRSLVAILILAIICFIKIDFIFEYIILAPADKDFITYRWLCQLGDFLNLQQLCLPSLDIQFQSIQMSGQFMMSVSSAFMIGFIVAFPYVFWEIWRFIKPALKSKELKHARGIVFWVSILFMVGVLFGYFLIAPFTINFFAHYSLSPKFHNIFTIQNYYSTLSSLIIGLGIVFELPVLVYFLARLGIITPDILKKIRRYAYLVILVLTAVITPPDAFSMMMVAIPLFFLYEGSILICRRAVKNKKKKEELDW